ncbi:MAG TPA: prepilin-type N-terminal cleavage/methylation domain-containing protein [Candidatus Acidoferrales bacterium]|jgi:type IV fimbrial biogenesis protein FimT|nr:prepilin-type N-terminal cleavage/methylation domain-containing protein [Candidatus Acidoferrales bacterium]
MRKYPNRPQRGFSLLEILTGLAIISIVLAMGMLNYSTILPNYKANSAMDQLLYQLRSARERAISHRREVQVQFGGTNQFTVTELWLVGTAPPATTVSFEGGAQYIVFSTIPDLPAPFNFGNTAAVYFGGVSGGPPVMKFSTTGSFIDGGNTLVNGTVFMGIPGKPSTARAISVLGATGRVREYHWDGTQWQE